MKDHISGQVIGKKGVGIAHLVAELWETDKEGNLLGEKPLLRSTTLSDGYFYLDIRRLPPEKKPPPDNSHILFRNGTGLEVGRAMVTSPAIEGESVRYENPKLVTADRIDIWPSDYPSLEQIPKAVKETFKKKTDSEELGAESVPQVVFFEAYAYLWPSPLDQNQPLQPTDNPLDRDFLVGTQVCYRQEWRELGTTLGELLHTLPLTPGEEATVEILSWDRNVYKREEEITSDLEREVEKNQQYKASREVIDEFQKTKNWHVGGKGSVSIWFVSVTADPGRYEEETKHFDKTTTNTIREATDRTSCKIRNQRKTLVSSTREFGSEEKVTRKIVNTNRCHAVAYHFYEKLSYYEVITSLVSPAARPCLFWKQKPPIEKSQLLVEPFQYQEFLETLRWLHFNSHLIARGLLDRSFYQAIELLPKLEAYWTLRRGVAATGADVDPLLRPPVSSLLSVAARLKNVAEMGSRDFGLAYFAFRIEGDCPWMLDLILRNSDSLLNKYKSIDPQASNALRPITEEFLALWKTQYAMTDQSTRQWFEGVFARHYLYHDINFLEHAFARAVFGPAPGQEPDESELARMQDVSQVIRLMRHIHDNHLHYFQLIWSAKDPGQRMLEVSNVYLPGDVRLTDVITPDLLGFYADYAVYPYKAEAGSQVDLLVQSFLKLEEEQPEELRKSEVVLPTNGIAVEPELFPSTACETFIQEHRKHDLELKQLEVNRHRKKIQNCELDNPECCPPVKYDFFHRLYCRFKGDEKNIDEHEK